MIIRLKVDLAAELWSAIDAMQTGPGSEWYDLARTVEAALDKADPDWVDNTSEDASDELLQEAIQEMEAQKNGKVVGGDQLVYLNLEPEEVDRLMRPEWA